MSLGLLSTVVAAGAVIAFVCWMFLGRNADQRELRLHRARRDAGRLHRLDVEIDRLQSERDRLTRNFD